MPAGLACRLVGNTWITDMRHYLDEAGALAAMPAPALNLALFLGSIGGWMTRGPVTGPERTNVRCRRSPGRERCAGEVVAAFELEEAGVAIVWACEWCGDNGVIRGWRGTGWDRGGLGAEIA